MDREPLAIKYLEWNTRLFIVSIQHICYAFF